LHPLARLFVVAYSTTKNLNLIGLIPDRFRK
jgi:hypothetical protein